MQVIFLFGRLTFIRNEVIQVAAHLQEAHRRICCGCTGYLLCPLSTPLQTPKGEENTIWRGFQTVQSPVCLSQGHLYKFV